MKKILFLVFAVLLSTTTFAQVAYIFNPPINKPVLRSFTLDLDISMMGKKMKTTSKYYITNIFTKVADSFQVSYTIDSIIILAIEKNKTTTFNTNIPPTEDEPEKLSEMRNMVGKTQIAPIGKNGKNYGSESDQFQTTFYIDLPTTTLTKNQTWSGTTTTENMGMTAESTIKNKITNITDKSIVIYSETKTNVMGMDMEVASTITLDRATGLVSSVVSDRTKNKLMMGMSFTTTIDAFATW
jgi:hypothetical protein